MSSISEIYDIYIQDSLFDPMGSPTSEAPTNRLDVRVKRELQNEKEVFNYPVYIYLMGEQAYLVEQVVYKLHPKVVPSEARVVRTTSNPNCKVMVNLWGTFEMTADVYLSTGQTIKLRHRLRFIEEINPTSGAIFSLE